MKLYKAMGGITILGAGLLALSGVFSDDKHGLKWVLGGIGWFGFLACVLGLVALALVALGHRLRRKALV